MKNRIKQILSVLVLFAFVASISSCNRGYGCPNNFKASVDQTAKVINTVKAVVNK